MHPVETWSTTARGLTFRGLACGDAHAPPVLLLHGFPEFSESWREVLPVLADAGLRAVAPDLRGCGDTDKPRDGYDLGSLAEDAAALAQGLGGRAHVAGHDWGGAIAYHLAALHPRRVARLAVINAPHPAAFRRQLLTHPAQLARSWYMFFFQVPWLPEYLLSRNGGALVPRLLRAASADRSRLTPERLAPYAQRFAHRETARGGLAYYRAAFRNLLPRRSRARDGALSGYPRIRAPFRLVWGLQDPALGPELTRDLQRWFEQPVDLRILPDHGHFLPLEAPELTGRLLAEHFLAHPLRIPESGPRPQPPSWQ